MSAASNAEPRASTSGSGPRSSLVAAWIAVCVTAAAAQSTPADEEVARRQLESGRSFARQGNFTEAIKDFRAVADTHPSSAAADNAWLEIARYYLDRVGDRPQASAAVEAILKKYPTSDSAPEAYLMAGRLALAKSRQPQDLDIALANFDRVSRLFPASDAVPRSLYLAGETLWHLRRYDDALSNLAVVEAEHAGTTAAADARLAAGRVLLSLGQPIAAMEEMQQIRSRWPATDAAALALARITLLHRLYVRARTGPAYELASEQVGPTRLENVRAVAVRNGEAVYWAAESGLGVALPATGAKPHVVARPRGLVVDSSGALVAFDQAGLRPETGNPVPLLLKRANEEPKLLDSVDAVVHLSNGDWLVMDNGERVIHRFSATGDYVGPFTTARVSRMALNAVDEVAGIDRDQRSIVLFDPTGKLTTRIPLRVPGSYELTNPEDLTFDDFGHLYVLDRTAIAVFTPHPAAPAAPGAKPPPAGFRLLTVFSEPERTQTGLRRGTAFGVDRAGVIYVHDERAQRILVYR
jgi:TolA-binding protein